MARCAIKSAIHHVSKCNESVKHATYLGGLIQSKLEYASLVWDPHLSTKDIRSYKQLRAYRELLLRG